MSVTEQVRERLATALGVDVGVDDAFDPPTFDVPPDRWIEALTVLRDDVGCTYFDWLSAVDELEQGFAVVCHVARPPRPPGHVRSQEDRASTGGGGSAAGEAAQGDAADDDSLVHVLLRTRVPRDAARLPTATTVYAGADWHERETHEMFGIDFDGHPNLVPLLLPDGFEGHPLRKEFVLAARVAKPWPGAKEPGESDHDAARAPSRRRVAPPGVPAPEAWGPRPPGSPEPDPLAVTAPARPGRRERPARASRPARSTPPGATAPRSTADQPPSSSASPAPGSPAPGSPAPGSSGPAPSGSVPSGRDQPTSAAGDDRTNGLEGGESHG
ncbi:NADH-quinone oxidoreductase subunit C [Thermasporomyces composti]|uniref:NADH-quinone oxidoreductase subunit C n=1 Tax=Thermasporomyces composti TaxID=696763 RepID=A0A3D9V6N0_THECX|nr:NADH-quinone oxidoreductase subunit C [Thermasporomyces composti]REF37139.1 NADH-quinone oxidoreductase subunit C [Thermasporomyces composti]